MGGLDGPGCVGGAGWAGLYRWGWMGGAGWAGWTGLVARGSWQNRTVFCCSHSALLVKETLSKKNRNMGEGPVSMTISQPAGRHLWLLDG